MHVRGLSHSRSRRALRPAAHRGMFEVYAPLADSWNCSPPTMSASRSASFTPTRSPAVLPSLPRSLTPTHLLTPTQPPSFTLSLPLTPNLSKSLSHSLTVTHAQFLFQSFPPHTSPSHSHTLSQSLTLNSSFSLTPLHPPLAARLIQVLSLTHSHSGVPTHTSATAAPYTISHLLPSDGGKTRRIVCGCSATYLPVG